MSRFAVVWLEEAEDELAAIWLQAHDRKAVTNAQAVIDARLAIDPVNNSTEVAEGLRKIVVLPLIAFFSLDETRSLVEVVQVVRSFS
jgi:plasmid stabilization system protein ParE